MMSELLLHRKKFKDDDLSVIFLSLAPVLYSPYFSLFFLGEFFFFLFNPTDHDFFVFVSGGWSVRGGEG